MLPDFLTFSDFTDRTPATPLATDLDLITTSGGA
jgi:hypothetical protein